MNRPVPGAALLLLACAIPACAAELCPDRSGACRNDPFCSGSAPARFERPCVVRRGCAGRRKLEIPPCSESIAAVPIQRFLEKPEAFPLPVIVAGRLEVHAWCTWRPLYLHVPPSPGWCGPECQGVMALVAALDEGDPERRRTRIEMIRDSFLLEPRYGAPDEMRSARGVALIRPSDRGEGRVRCEGDYTGICCEYPLDGREVRATFRRRLDPPPAQPYGEGFYFTDYDGLVAEDLCATAGPYPTPSAAPQPRPAPPVSN